MQFPASLRLALSLALAAVFAWLFLSLWRRDRQEPALAFWGAAHCTWFAAALAFALESQLPPRMGLTLGNMGVALGYGLLWGGARRFAGRTVPLPAVGAGALLWLLLELGIGIHADLATRVAIITAITVGYDVATARAFLGDRRRQRLPSHGAVIGLLAAHAAVFGLRLLGALGLSPAGPPPLPPAATWTTILTVLSLALTAAITVLLVALTRERSEIVSNAVLARARDVARAANEEKSRFLARMSHELRTPLNGVLGMAQALARDPSLGPAQREQARTLEASGRHLMAIVNDVLDLARVEAGRLELAPQPFDLHGLLAEVDSMLQGVAVPRRMTLTREIAPGVPRGVLADPLRLRQILLNLLGNALKFTPEGGRVTLAAAPAPDGAVRISVTDTGPGVPPAIRPRLFRETIQGDAALEGTGLGLVISAALARAMGGTLVYAPGPAGLGSVFSLTLPLPPATLPAAAPPALASTPPDSGTGRPLRLLVVDDVRANRLVIRALLAPEGHVVVEAEDGPAALAALARLPLPDAVLMDVNMPGMDGYQATAAIRALPGPAATLPIIALTGDAMPEAVAAARDAGMDHHLTKPVDRARLLALLARLSPPAR